MSNSVLNINPAPSCPSSDLLQPGSSFLSRIEKLVAGGMGLARWKGQVVLCPDAIPGETVLVEIAARRRGVMYGKILEVRQPAPDRIVPVCPVAGICGGCQMQHVAYAGQREYKEHILRDALSRIGKFSGLAIAPIIPSPQPFGYRQILRLGIERKTNGWLLGFFESGSQHLLPVDTCFLVSEDFRRLISQLAERLQGLELSDHALVNVEIRWSAFEKKYLLIFQGQSRDEQEIGEVMEACADLPDVQGWMYEPVKFLSSSRGRSFTEKAHVRGVDHVWEMFNGLRVKIGYRSFMQANWPLFEEMGRLVQAWMGDLSGKRLLELYAGTGILGMWMARAGGRVTGVELNGYAVQDARHSIQVNKITGCRMKAVSVESYLTTVQAGDFEMVLLDPPRTGLRPKVLEQLAALLVPRLFYISCDPPSLARDLKALCANGYAIHRVQPVDMFPQTAHLETLVELITSHR